MKLYTLWKHDGDDKNMPWIVDAIDEFSVDENNGYPPDYEKKMKDAEVRELVIEISEDAVRKIFHSKVITGKVVEP